jgi:hypothetical protein
MCLVVAESVETADIYSSFQITFNFIFFAQSVKFLEFKQEQLISLWKPKNSKHYTSIKTFSFPSTTKGNYYMYTYFRIRSINNDHKAYPSKQWDYGTTPKLEIILLQQYWSTSLQTTRNLYPFDATPTNAAYQ